MKKSIFYILALLILGCKYSSSFMMEEHHTGKYFEVGYSGLAFYKNSNPREIKLSFSVKNKTDKKYLVLTSVKSKSETYIDELELGAKEAVDYSFPVRHSNVDSSYHCCFYLVNAEMYEQLIDSIDFTVIVKNKDYLDLQNFMKRFR